MTTPSDPKPSPFSASLDRLQACLADLVGAAPQPGAFGAVTLHITPAMDANALPLERWVYDAQVLLACLRAIEPAAQMRINVTGLGAMYHRALHKDGVEAGQFVNMADKGPCAAALALIPEALRPCKPSGLPARHVVLADAPGPSSD